MKKKDNFTKLYEMVLDSYEDMEEMFSESEIRAINQGKKPWVVFALDRLFSGWGKSKNGSNHVLVVCWSHEQRFNIEQSLKDAHEMSYVTSSSLEFYWIEISELDCIKVIRYMLEFSKKDEKWNTHKEFLKGWMQDCINQARFEKICNKHNYDEKFYV